MSALRLGIIGAGGMAQQHMTVLAAMPGVEVCGIMSRTLPKAQALAQQFNVPVCVTTVKELVEQAKPDALLVLVSVDQMFSVVKSVLPLRLPLFIEKPPALSLPEAGELARMAEEINIITMVGLNRRYYSIFHKGLQIIKDHGPLFGVHVEGHERFWQKRENPNPKFSPQVMDKWIFANSIHTIDLVRFFGGDITSVHAAARAYREAGGDQFAAVMETDTGVIAQYQAFWYSPGGWRVVLYGNGATVEFKPLEKGTWMDNNFKSYDILPDVQDVDFKPGLLGQMQAFVKMVKTGHLEWPAQDLQGAYKTMDLAQKLCAPLAKENTCGH